MAIYVKLGSKAAGFSDPQNLLTLGIGEVKEVTKTSLASPRTKTALAGGHLKRASKADFLSFKKRMRIADGNKSPSPISGKQSVIVTEFEKEITSLKGRITDLEVLNQELVLENDKLKNGTPGPEDLHHDDLPDFDEMDSEELVKYYTENFTVDEKQEKAFTKLSDEKKRAKLEELEMIED